MHVIEVRNYHKCYNIQNTAFNFVTGNMDDMKKRTLLVTIATVLFSLAPSTFALELYQTDMPVLSQSDDERVDAVRLGFQKLLIQLTGDPQIDRIPDIKEAIGRANYYVSEVSYALPTPQSSTYSLHVKYEEADITRLLKRDGITFWGEERPLLLVWLAVTDKHNVTEIIGDESHSRLVNHLKKEGDKLGLPLICPLMDMTDMSQVTASQVTSMALPALQEAGKRYSPNGYLIGKIAPLDSGYDSEWELIIGS